MNYLMILIGYISYLSLSHTANINECSDHLCFSQLTHDELTKLWCQDHYQYDFFKGKCLSCEENKDVIGQKGCLYFNEPDGLCGDCIIEVLQSGFELSLYYDDSVTIELIQKMKSNNYSLPAHHILADNSLHLCKLSKSGLQEALLKDIPKEWLAYKDKILKIFNDNEKELNEMNIIKSLPFLCKLCNKFKIYDHASEVMFTKGHRWFVSCPGCASFVSLLTNNCSIFHCSTCRDKGVSVATCAYCFQVSVNHKVVKEGYKPEINHNCPSSCIEYFHGNINKNRLPGDDLICICPQ